MLTIIILLILLISNIQLHSQEQVIQELLNSVSVPSGLFYKIGSSELLKEINKKKNNLNKGKAETIEVVIYASEYPAEKGLNYFNDFGIKPIPGTWLPPVQDHPLGFFIAEIPVNNFTDILNLDFIKRIDIAEELSFPQNNEAAKLINADKVWLKGFTGTGIKIAILDSGLDTDFAGTDLPLSLQKKDYSSYPTLDDDVENRVTGHGTHVTGSVLSRGVLSETNIANGGGAYKGIAPDAELVFLKIGNDVTGAAKTSAITEALKAAVNIYDADIISMSYGSWDIYHDGSNTKDQAVDWCYSQGAAVFIAAGNEGNNKRHFSGYLNANDSSDFVQVDITNSPANTTYLAFNLVWSDGTERKNLIIKYYNSLGGEIPEIYRWSNTASIRGTESQLSQTLFTVPSGNSAYYLKVFNLSDSPQQYHIYEHFNNGKVTFANYNPEYTIISPATADHAFTVGAYVSRNEWVFYNGNTNSTTQGPVESIASFSSRGPRIDGLLKPDIVAPGSSVISLKDGNIYSLPNSNSIDNDGILSGETNYYIMEGTSMAAPLCAGAAALYLSKFPGSSPEEVYNALRGSALNDSFTGSMANSTYGYGKLDIYHAIDPTEPLPVELVSFTGKIIENKVQLIWETATEVNNYGFEIERSFKDGNWKTSLSRLLDGKWEMIGFISGNGNSNSVKKYSFVDDQLNSGRYLYRLKQIDSDGTFSYSQTVEVDYSLIKDFELYQNYPNPFNPSTIIKYSLPFESSIELALYNSLGETVSILARDFQPAGVYDFEFNNESLSSGIYFYKLTALTNDGKIITSVKKMIISK